MKQLYGIFFGLSALLVSFIQASEEPTAALTPMQVAEMYKAYDEYKDDFINHLPVSVKLCQQRLMADQRSISETIDSFSYKNVFLSKYGILKTGMLMASLVGLWAVPNKLERDDQAYYVANNFANARFMDFIASSTGRVFIPEGKKSRHNVSQERMVETIAAQNTDKRQNIHDIPNDAWSKAVTQLPARTNINSQLSPADRIKEIKKYQLGARALAVVGAISGLGIYDDIKAMQMKKAELATKLQKINNMLTVLEKAQ